MSSLPSIGLCILSHQRPDDLLQALESSVGQPFVERLVFDQGSAPPLPERDGVRTLRSRTNLGASAGRNRLVDAATADICLFLDDDAALHPGAAEAVREAFADDARLGAVALRIVRADGSLERIEQPVLPWRPIPSRSGPCGYFITAGCAVRRRAWEEVEGGDERLVYGADDLQMALRMAEAGWGMRYLVDAIVEHRPSSRGRLRSAERAGHHVHNRVLMVRRSLPRPIAAVHAVLWAAITAREAHVDGGLRFWASSLRSALLTPVEPRRMSVCQAARLQRLGGRVLY